MCQVDLHDLQQGVHFLQMWFSHVHPVAKHRKTQEIQISIHLIYNLTCYLTFYQSLHLIKCVLTVILPLFCLLVSPLVVYIPRAPCIKQTHRVKLCRSSTTSSPAEAALLGAAAASWTLPAAACLLHREESIQSCTHVSTGRQTSSEQEA